MFELLYPWLTALSNLNGVPSGGFCVLVLRVPDGLEHLLANYGRHHQFQLQQQRKQHFVTGDTLYEWGHLWMLDLVELAVMVVDLLKSNGQRCDCERSL